ncbi:MAG: hypothetical protein AAF564_23120 [Bacteroidota bacterium]
MIQRDFILRQIQQLVQVLTRVLKLKQDGQTTEVAAVVDTALQETMGMGLGDLAALPADDLLALCSENGQLHADKAFVVAELLEASFIDGVAEDAPANPLKAALLLYEALVASGEAVPFDIYDRIAYLKQEISPGA